MPTIVIDVKTVEHSIDAKFAYTDLKYNESKNAWEYIDKDDIDDPNDKTDKLEIYKTANEANKIEINILAHEKDAASGFQATLIEKTDASGHITKTITIAGTDKWDMQDWTANYSIYKGEVPGLQYKALTDFITELIDENKISKADNITMVGSSLGGTMTQMGAATFTDFIDQAYTFNAPGAANFTATAEQANAWNWNSETYFHFNEFTFNKYNVGDTIINFTSANVITFIADYGETPEQDDDIGVEFRIPGSYHGIQEVIGDLEILLAANCTTSEQLDYLIEQFDKITDYYNPGTDASIFNENFLIRNTGVVNYLLQVVENDIGKVISLDDNTSFEFVEDNNLTINIDNSVSDTSPSEAIKNLEDVLRIEQINSINTKTTASLSSYTIKSGDTLSAIAESNNISLDDLLSANSTNITNPNQINIGDQISLPSITTSTYTVQAGDSISDIADKLGITPESLIDSNSWLNDNLNGKGEDAIQGASFLLAA